jgi:hypothetical protein
MKSASAHWKATAVAVGAMIFLLADTRLTLAGHGDPHASITTWPVGNAPIFGFDPHETVDDVSGTTAHVGAPAMVTFMENTVGGSCGLLFWNPSTDFFKTYPVTGGFDFAGDIHRGAPAPGGPPSPHGTFGGGDAWSTVNGNDSFTPYVNFRGSDNFRRWTGISSSGTGIRVNPDNGKVYFGHFGFPGEIIELDPATNGVRRWATGNNPYNLVLDATFVWATASAFGVRPDEIVRLDPATNVLTRCGACQRQ